VPAGVLRDWLNDWFPLGRHLIEGLYGTARSIESTVRQRESLVTLGKLAAGLAHEINNPAARGRRAATGQLIRAGNGCAQVAGPEQTAASPTGRVTSGAHLPGCGQPGENGRPVRSGRLARLGWPLRP
jgi:hypothetical protein